MVLPLMGLLGLAGAAVAGPYAREHARNTAASGAADRFADSEIDFTSGATPEQYTQQALAAGILPEVRSAVDNAFGTRDNRERLAQSNINSQRSAGVAMRGQDLVHERWLAEQARTAQMHELNVNAALAAGMPPKYRNDPVAVSNYMRLSMESEFSDPLAAARERLENEVAIQEAQSALLKPQIEEQRRQALVTDIDAALTALDESLFNPGAQNRVEGALDTAQLNEMMMVYRAYLWRELQGRTDAPTAEEREEILLSAPTIEATWSPLNDAAKTATVQRALMRLRELQGG